MAKNVQEIPFAEIVERVQKLARLADNAVEKIRGVVQDVYLRETPAKFDWTFLLASSSITSVAEYKDGTVSVNTGATSLTFSSDVVTDATFTGRRFRPSGADDVYDFTFSQTTGGTIAPSFQATQNAAGASYSIFKPFYALAGDFDRFPTNGGLYKWEGGRKKALSELFYQQTYDHPSMTPSTPEYVRLVGQDTAGNQLVELIPPPDKARNYGYDYIKRLRPLIQSTGLLLSISANATTVLGLQGRSQFNDATTGDWIRVDELGKGQDSEWYRIIAIANNSSLTLATAFANTAITGSANYTISRAPEMPPMLHPAIMYGALKYLMQDQNDPQFQVYMMRYAEVMSDGKRLYTSRVIPQIVDTIATDYRYRR